MTSALQQIDSATLEQYRPTWQQLCDNTDQAPVSLAPNLAIPVIKAINKHAAVFALQHWREQSLLGLCFVEAQRWRWGWPYLIWHSWQTPLTFSGTPLLAKHAQPDDVAALLAAAKAPLLLQAVCCEGAFWAQLAQAAQILNAPYQIINTWQRAALRPTQSFDAWYETNFDRKRRKEYRRLRKRLADLGELQSTNWQHDESVQPWLDAFLALEAKGWKGQRGTALASQQLMAEGVSEAVNAFARQQQLRFWALKLNGQTIATLFAFVCGDTAWLAKIAYDEAYGKFSPGVLLILDATADLLNEHGIKLVDSCAIPNHPMIDNIWRDRIQMADLLIGTPGLAPWRFKLMVKAELLRRRLRETAKSIFYYATNRHRS
ncbi:MAG: GNAT family N-acetyltransferase [Methylococcales bacterium]